MIELMQQGSPVSDQAGSGEPQAPTQNTSNVSSSSTAKRLFMAAALVLVLASGGGFFYVLPRKDAVAFAQKISPVAKQTASSIADVNQHAQRMFELISGEQSQSTSKAFLDVSNLPDYLRDLLNRGKQVAGAKIGGELMLTEYMREVASAFDATVDKFKKERSADRRVAGAKTIQAEDQLTQNLRKLKDLALEEESSSKDGMSLLDKIKAFFSGGIPSRAKPKLSSAGTILSDTEDYLTEAQKVGSYYRIIADVNLELYPTLISVNNFVLDLYSVIELPAWPGAAAYEAKINELKNTLADLKAQIDGLEDVPTGMEKLHADNKQVMKLLDELMDELEIAVKANSYAMYVDAVNKFSLSYDVLADRAVSYELSFWQNTTVLKNYQSLSKDFEEFQSSIEAIEKENELPF